MKSVLTIFSFLFLLFIWCGSIMAQEADPFGLAPQNLLERPTSHYPLHYGGDSPLANTGFGTDAIASPIPFISMPIPAGTPFTPVNPNFAPGWLAGGDIDATGVYYGCTYVGAGASDLVTVDLTNGTPTLVGSITGFTLFPTSLAYNYANSTWYFGDTDGAASNLYTVDVSTGAASLVGPLTGLTGLIGMAIDCNGAAYGVDISTDQLFSIDLSTGASTPIGPLGFDASFAQDCDFDAATGTMYLAAYNAGLSQGEFRSVDLSTGATTLITPWVGSEVTGFAIDNPCGPPCPVDPPTNPSPPSGAIDVPINGNTATWDNGAGTTQVELYFGEVGSLVQVYDGPAITSFSLGPVEPLDYSTQYGWRVVCKNDTCGVSGPTWTFTTVNPPGVVFYEPFPDLANWTIAGPLGIDNWSTVPSNSAGGASGPPELEFYWSPSFVGLSVIQTTVPIPVDITHNHTIKFNHFIDHYADPCGPMGFGVSTDGGATWITIWEITPTGDVGPEELVFSGIMPPASPITLLFYYNGDSFNINWWDIDDLWLIDDDWIPVELSSFTAKANEGLVELNWSTSTETNNSGFQIERSNGSEFENIGFVAGHGTTTEIQYYSFTDKNLDPGTYSYRLKQVDLDGTYEYSDVVEVDVTAPLTFALDQNYPNPFNPGTIITFKLAADSKVSLKVFNVLGQEVMSLINTDLSAGSHEVEFNASNLGSGIYIYKIEATGADGTNFIDAKKMTLTK